MKRFCLQAVGKQVGSDNGREALLHAGKLYSGNTPAWQNDLLRPQRKTPAAHVEESARIKNCAWGQPCNAFLGHDVCCWVAESISQA